MVDLAVNYLPAPGSGERAPMLALETSGRALAVALWGAKGLILEKRVQDGARHGVALAPISRQLLDLAKLDVRDLSGMAVSIGPGSWTGLRIGLAAAKTMAWAAGIQLVPTPSFEALAVAAREVAELKTQGRESPAAVLTVRNAYSEGCFAALFAPGKDSVSGLRRLIPECVCRPEDLADLVRATFHEAGLSGSILLAGDATCLEQLKESARVEGWWALDGMEEIPAGVIARLGWEMLNSGRALKTPAEIHAASPLYLRASDPELKLKRKQEERGTDG